MPLFSPIHAKQSILSNGKSRLQSALERCRRCSAALNHDQIVVLALEAGRLKVRGAGSQRSPVDLVALEVHRSGGNAAEH